jgi:hypothetical protein
MKLTPGVNVINILQVAFHMKVVYMFLQFGFVIVCGSKLAKKAAHEMMVKLNIGRQAPTSASQALY